MSADHSLVIQLYWGGKIVHAGGSILYDPPMPKKVIFLREKVGFEELVDKIYNIMDIDRERFKISLIFRSCLHRGVFGAMPLVDNDGMDAMYFLKANSGQATEIYVEVEDVPKLEEHDTQANQIASSHLNRCTSLHGPMDVVGKAGLYKGQLTHGVQPSKRGWRRDRRRGNNADTVYMPSAETDIEYVDTDVDSEPEPEDDEFEDDAEDDDFEPKPKDDESEDDAQGYVASGQGVNSNEKAITHQHMDPRSSWTNDKIRTLSYDAGIDANLQFDPLSKGSVEKLNVCNEHTKEVRLGQLFETKEHVQRAVKLWSIQEQREYKVRESTSTTWFVRCKWYVRCNPRTCNWQLRASLRSSHTMWMIVTLADGHTCVPMCNRNDHRQLSGDIIAEHIIPHINNDPLFKVKEIQASVKQEFQCDVSYKKAWYARRRAIEKQSRPLKTAEIRNEMDQKCPDIPRRCTNCLQPGHNAPNCPYLGFFHH